jgi:DUF1365 family protein
LRFSLNIKHPQDSIHLGFSYLLEIYLTVPWLSTLTDTLQMSSLPGLGLGPLSIIAATVAAGLFVLPFVNDKAQTAKDGCVRRSCLYFGKIWHSRFVPVVHNFWYHICFAYLDLAEVEAGALDKLWPLAASNRMAIASLNDIDHLKGYLEGQGLTLQERVRRLVEERTGERPKGPIGLLTHPRIMGYCYNSASFFYCFDESGTRVETVVTEVSNSPWEEMHMYVLNARSEGVQVQAKREGELHYRFPKEIHLSPFLDMDMMYEWSFLTPGKRTWVAVDVLKEATR